MSHEQGKNSTVERLGLVNSEVLFKHDENES